MFPIIIFQNEFENNFFLDSFLDLTNCDQNEREKIISLLKPNSSNQPSEFPWDKSENEYHDHIKPSQVEEIPKVWSQYGKTFI